MTMKFARLSSLPSSRCCSDTGCASAGLPPMMIMRLGVADVVVAVGHRAVAPGIGHARDGGRMADARLVVDVVGAPERRELADRDRRPRWRTSRSPASRPRLRPRLLADRHQLVADLVDRLLPGQPGPLPVHELHRIFQAAVAVHELAHRRALGAVRAAVDRAIPVRAPGRSTRRSATSAITVQPTEQCVQMFLRMVTCAPARRGGPAFALRTLPSGSVPSVARAAGDEARAAQEGCGGRGRRPDWPCSAPASVPRRA